LTKLALSLAEVSRFFVRIHGRLGVHELRAVIDTASPLCIINKRDLIELGYHAFYGPNIANVGEGTKVLTPYYMIKAPTVKVSKIQVGGIEVSDVAAIGQDLTEDLGVDVVLGGSFMKHLKVTFDYPAGEVVLEEEPTRGDA
jgi:predicted aspartyl protease